MAAPSGLSSDAPMLLGDVADHLKRLFRTADGHPAVDPPIKFRQVYEAMRFTDDDPVSTFFDVAAGTPRAWLEGFPPNFGSKPQFDRMKTYTKRLLLDPVVREKLGDRRCDDWWKAIKAGFDAHASAIIEARRGRGSEGTPEGTLQGDVSGDRLTEYLEGAEGARSEFEEDDEVETVSVDRLTALKKRLRDYEEKEARAELESLKARFERMKTIFHAFAQAKTSEVEFQYVDLIVRTL